jgi:hypothetical protein
MIITFNSHMLNINNVVELKWHPETSEMVYCTIQGDWYGISGTKKEYDALVKKLSASLGEEVKEEKVEQK